MKEFEEYVAELHNQYDVVIALPQGASFEDARSAEEKAREETPDAGEMYTFTIEILVSRHEKHYFVCGRRNQVLPTKHSAKIRLEGKMIYLELALMFPSPYYDRGEASDAIRCLASRYFGARLESGYSVYHRASMIVLSTTYPINS